MPTLVVPPRITPDTDAMLAAALAAGWDAERLVSWRVTAGLSQHDPVLYGEPLFADVVSGAPASTAATRSGCCMCSDARWCHAPR